MTEILEIILFGLVSQTDPQRKMKPAAPIPGGAEKDPVSENAYRILFCILHSFNNRLSHVFSLFRQIPHFFPLLNTCNRKFTKYPHL